MTQLNYFKDTSLIELKAKFEELIKDTTTEEEQQKIAISLVLDKYKQLHRKLNVIRKASNLLPSQIDTIKDLQAIKNKHNSLIEELNLEIEKHLEAKQNLKEEQESSKFKTTTIKIGDKEFKVEIAESDKEKEEGLSNRKSLDKNKGMLFVWEEPETVGIWMKDTLIPLDIIFINEDLTVFKVYEGIPETEDIMEEDNVVFVLELNSNSEIKEGDELEFLPDSKTKLDKMIVLNDDGTPQMILEGGERIFSRENTKILVKFAKKAFYTKKESDYKALGKRVFKFLETQDSNPAEYVEKK